MFVNITKDYEKNRLFMRYGENHSVLVPSRFVKELPAGIEAFNNSLPIHQKNALNDLLGNFAKHSPIPFKQPSYKTAITWITKNVTHIQLIGFEEDEYLTQYICKNIAGKNCMVTVDGKAKG